VERNRKKTRGEVSISVRFRCALQGSRVKRTRTSPVIDMAKSNRKSQWCGPNLKCGSFDFPVRIGILRSETSHRQRGIGVAAVSTSPCITP
jgi:hypothetical protein